MRISGVGSGHVLSFAGLSLYVVELPSELQDLCTALSAFLHAVGDLIPPALPNVCCYPFLY
jgi:hypothetical protein